MATKTLSEIIDNISYIVGRQLGIPFEAEDIVYHRGKQVLIMDNGDNGEKDYQESGERQRFLEGMSQVMFFNNTIQSSQQDDD